jgi:hypothetical protein
VGGVVATEYLKWSRIARSVKPVSPALYQNVMTLAKILRALPVCGV